MIEDSATLGAATGNGAVASDIKRPKSVLEVKDLSIFFQLGRSEAAHHDSALSQRLNQPASARATKDFFNEIGHMRKSRPLPEAWKIAIVSATSRAQDVPKS
jgi:hypothetical protein